MTPSPRRRSLLREHDVALIWTAGLLAWIGNLALFVVLPFVVFESTSSPIATAITVLGGAVPPVLVGPLAGVLADRWDRRRMLLGADIALAVLTLGYLVIDSGAWVWLAGLTFLRSCVAQLIGPAEHALLPELVPADRMGEVAALNTLNNTIARLVGPALGGVLLATTGLAGVVVLVALCYTGAAASVAAVRHRRLVEAKLSDSGLLRQWREGAVLAWREPVLRALVPLMALLTVGEGFVSALLAPFTREMLDAGADALGWILSAQAIGGIAGARWYSRVANRHDPLQVLALAAVAAGALLAVVFSYPSFAPVLWPAVALTAIAGAPFAVMAAAQGLILQRHVTPAARGRVFGLFWALASLMQIIGIVIAGMLAEQLGSIVILVDAIAYLVAGALGMVAVARLRRAATDGRGTTR